MNFPGRHAPRPPTPRLTLLFVFLPDQWGIASSTPAKGTGRKGEKPPRKRKKITSVYHTLIDDNSTDTFEQEMATSSGSITPNSHAQSVE